MNDITLFKGGLPSYVRRGSDEMTLALAGGSVGMRRISIKGNAFRELVGGKEYRVAEGRSLNVIIVNSAPKVSRTYYEGTYAEGDAVRPTCWSSDSTKPDPEVKNKKSMACHNCPMNIKGSGQGDSRACKFSQRLAVVIDGELEKEEVYQITIPATSIFGSGDGMKMPLQEYAKFLVKEGAYASCVVTEMKFDINSPVPKLFFRPIRVLEEHEFEIVERLKESDDAKRAISITVSQADNVQKEPESVATSAPKAAPKPAPVEESEEEEAEIIEEPKKAAPKKTSPVATSEPKLEDLVGEWDD